MKDMEQQRKFRGTRAVRRRLFGAGFLTAALAAVILSMPTGSDYTASDREMTSTGPGEELAITQVGRPTEEAPVLASTEEEPGGEAVLGFSASGQPEYVTTQPPIIDIQTPLLVADNWMPSVPGSVDELDAQPAIHIQGSRSPAIAGVRGGGYGRPYSAASPRGPAAPSFGGGSPSGGGKSRPGKPSSDPISANDGPMFAGPDTAPPPANNQPAPVNLPDELSGPVVGSNDDPQDDWLSPGNSPGILELDNFTLGGQTLLFEILGPSDDSPVEYDQLIVEGNVNLDAGNIVFAFIDGYVPPDASVLFDLIVAGSITYAEGDPDVHFYYGFFDTPYNEHAPYDLSDYFVWTPESGIDRNFIDGSQDLLQISYSPDGTPETTEGPEQSFDPVTIGAEVPAPAPLLLLATGLLLAGGFRRRA